MIPPPSPLGGGIPRARLAAVSTDGTVLAWDPAADNQVYGVALAEDGTLYAGGFFTVLFGEPHAYIAGIDAAGAPLAWGPVLDGPAYVLLPVGEQLWIGGGFGFVEGRHIRGLAVVER